MYSYLKIFVAAIFLTIWAAGDPCLPQEGIRYRIINRASAKALESSNGAIRQRFFTGADAQTWKFSLSNTSYIITNAHTNAILDLFTLPNLTPPANNIRTGNQKWIIKEDSDGFCKISNHLFDMFFLNVDKNSTEEGATLIAAINSSASCQQWKLEVVSSKSKDCPNGWGLIKKFDFPNLEKVYEDWALMKWRANMTGKVKRNAVNYKNVFVRDDHLIIKAVREDYTNGKFISSARLKTRQTYTPFEAPGKKLRVEFTGKIPTADGGWPAYWLVGVTDTYGQWPASGEIDLIEWVHNLNDSFNSNLHWDNSTGGHKSKGCKFNVTKEELSSTFITYGVEYSVASGDEYIQFYIRHEDGELVNATKIDQSTFANFGHCPNGKKSSQFPCSPLAPFDNYMNIIINLAAGIDWGAAGVKDFSAFNQGVELETSAVTVCEKL